MNHIKSQSIPCTTSNFLSDLSERDRLWDSHRRKTTQVERIYQGSEAHQDYAERMHVCSTFLDFRLVPDEELLKLKLSRASFCRVRFCPVCQWRRSNAWHAKALTIVPKVLEAYPTYRWLFLTLTVKNSPISGLRDEIKHLNKSFERLSQLKNFPAEGWIKCVEVTRGEDGLAHPHFHVLMIVKSSYFTTNYLSFDKWRMMWRKSARLNYDPQIKVKPIKEDKNKKTETQETVISLTQAVCEVIKYQVKESDLTADPKWTLELTDQLKKTRAISTGGILKAYFRELENEPEDLIGKGEEEEETLGHVFATWRRDCQRYVIRD